MKKIVYLSLLLSGGVFAQNATSIGSSEYNSAKTNGLISPTGNYQFTDLPNSTPVHYSGVKQKSGTCDCMIPLDSTFTLAMLPNDDSYSGIINLPFDFSFYGINYDSLYINNNGNISFLSPYSSFTSNPFPDSMYNMIAPFWADVDTRGSFDSLSLPMNNGGAVWYKTTASSLIVKWEQVGYFPNMTDKTNTFQLIISNGLDTLIPNGNNVAFCYGDMQWTTGVASNGINGFGGTPATVGVNYGNGIDFFQVGRFDTIGSNFDGPYGSNDQIDFLDDMEVYFNIAVSSSSSNVPPMVIASGICDTIDVYTGDTLIKANNQFDFSVLVTTPEPNQEVFATVSCPLAPLAVTYTSTTISQEAKNLDITINATGLTPGIYNLIIDAVDNGLPTASSTSVNIPFRVNFDASLSIFNNEMDKLEVYPNPTSDLIHVTLPEGQTTATLSVSNLQGEQVLNRIITTNEGISLATLSSGVYFVSLKDKTGNTTTTRVVKK